MQPDTILGMRTKLGLLLGLAVSLASAACGDGMNNPPAGDKAYAEGTLGNGGFLFSCGDGAACLPYAGEAKKFPTMIASGSTFELRFVAKGDQGATIWVDDRKFEGITVDGVMPYVSRGIDGLTAVKPGYGTVFAQDNAGTIVDYVTVRIVKPDALVVYDAELENEKQPQRTEKIELKVGATRSFRVVGEVGRTASTGGTMVAGSIRTSWLSQDNSVVRIDGYTEGLATLRGNAVGITKVAITGAGLTDTLVDVEVSE